MVKKITTLVVDQNFFDKIFEIERIKMQKKIGVRLTQTNFTKMIKGLKIKQPKQNLSQVNTRFKRKNVGI